MNIRTRHVFTLGFGISLLLLPLAACRKEVSASGTVTNSLTKEPFPGVEIVLQEFCHCTRAYVFGSNRWETESDENGLYTFDFKTKRQNNYRYDMYVPAMLVVDTISEIARAYTPDILFNQTELLKKEENNRKDFRVFPGVRVIVVLRKSNQPVEKYRVQSFDRSGDSTFMTSGSIPFDNVFTRVLPVIDSLIFIRVDRTIIGQTDTRVDTLRAKQFELRRYRVNI